MIPAAVHSGTLSRVIKGSRWVCKRIQPSPRQTHNRERPETMHATVFVRLNSIQHYSESDLIH